MPGRPSKLTPETQQKIVQAITLGATYELAAAYGGIHYDTFNEWMKLGAIGKKPYSDFSEAVKEAEGRAAVGWLAKIEMAANDGNWQAAAWKLERRYPHSYGRQVQEHAGEVEVTVKAYKTVSPDDWPGKEE
jgi:transposase